MNAEERKSIVTHSDPERVMHAMQFAAMQDQQRIYIEEISKLNQQVGFLEGVLFTIQNLGVDEIPEAVANSLDRYQVLSAKVNSDAKKHGA